MTGEIHILLAEPNYIVRRGLEALLAENTDFDLCSVVQQKEELFPALELHRPHVIIIDYNHFPEGLEMLRKVTKKWTSTHILVITDPKNKGEINRALEYGVSSFLLKECDRDEIMEAIYKTAANQKFLCGRIAEKLTNEGEAESVNSQMSCAGLNITEREIEIIRLVSEGLSNKEIADKLFLSTHTVTTHRKNIMNKLQVNNTAGLVLFAVRNDLLGPNKFLFS